MLGGGTFITQNKVLPGTYQNFVSARRSFLNLSDRGFVALPLDISWGPKEVVTITAEEFQKGDVKALGYKFDDEKMKPLREVLLNAPTVYLYPLKGTSAAKATNTFADAKYTGTRGNALKIVIKANVDTPANFDVQTLLDNEVVDEQLDVVNAAALVSNDYVDFKPGATLAVNAGASLSGGTDGTINLASYQEAFDEFEAFNFNALIIDSTEENVKNLAVAYTNRMRNEVGMKFQTVIYNAVTKPDSEGVINLFNKATEGDTKLVYWVGGASAGVAVNASNLNKAYNGEYTVDYTGAKTQTQLTNLIKDGMYALHKVNADARVLADINSLTTFTVDKNENFSLNQVIRVLDQIAIDTANIFNSRYLGKVPNDQDGRISLWGDVVANRNELNRLRAIQNYDSSKLTVAQGVQKDGVVLTEEIETTVAMAKLYVTTVVA